MLGEDYLSYFVEVEPGIKIHVLEVGSGYPVYLQHGNPTSDPGQLFNDSLYSRTNSANSIRERAVFDGFTGHTLGNLTITQGRTINTQLRLVVIGGSDILDCEIVNFPGVSAPYEAPTDADLILATDTVEVTECVDQIIELLKQREFII